MLIRCSEIFIIVDVENIVLLNISVETVVLFFSGFFDEYKV